MMIPDHCAPAVVEEKLIVTGTLTINFNSGKSIEVSKTEETTTEDYAVNNTKYTLEYFFPEFVVWWSNDESGSYYIEHACNGHMGGSQLKYDSIEFTRFFLNVRKESDQPTPFPQANLVTANNEPTLAEADLKDLVKYGYAPGGYESRCFNCHMTFVGEKRAFACLNCAVEELIKNNPKEFSAEELADCKFIKVDGEWRYKRDIGVK